MNKRDEYIDFLRFLGLSLVILAHVNSPFVVSQIRCFDVPLMLFASGLSYSRKVLDSSLNNFYLPRIKRLLIPVYLFLLLYFVIYFVSGGKFEYSFVLGSLCLSYDYGVKFVWIIRVFLLIMLATPLFIKLENRLSNFSLIILFAAMSILLEICVYFTRYISSSFLESLYEETFLWFLAYSIFFILGLKLRYANSSTKYFFTLLSSIIFVLSIVNYYLAYGLPFSLTPNFKYPPHSYYVIYGCWICLLLWLLKPLFLPICNLSIIRFLGSNTIWIYLWHIIGLLIINKISDAWYLRYIGTYLIAATIAFVQVKSTECCQKVYPSSMWKYLRG